MRRCFRLRSRRCSWCRWFVGSGTRRRRYSALEVLFYSYVVVVVCTLPVALYTEPATFRSIPDFRPQVWLGFLSLAVLQYFFAMLIFLTVLTRLDATQAGLSNYLITFFGVLAAVLVLGERFTANMVIGGLLVLSGTLLVTLYEGRKKPEAPAKMAASRQ